MKKKLLIGAALALCLTAQPVAAMDTCYQAGEKFGAWVGDQMLQSFPPCGIGMRVFAVNSICKGNDGLTHQILGEVRVRITASQICTHWKGTDNGHPFKYTKCNDIPPCEKRRR